MKRIATVAVFVSFILIGGVKGQTIVPNGDFENWTNSGSYMNPTGWDTPNQAIAIGLPFGTQVVTRSTSHESGSFSARLETKHLSFPFLNVPGIVTLGTLTIDIFNQTVTVSGGVPINDMPTHLKGFYKYLPQGGDSCVIGIALSRWNNGTRDSVGLGVFSTPSTINDWTPFYAWIYYHLEETPDTFDISAISSADSNGTPGTVLYLDDLSLDYTTGINQDDPASGIEIYQDREEQQILVYFDFMKPEASEMQLFNMTGKAVESTPVETLQKNRRILKYQGFSAGVYILEILHDGKKYCKKFFINN